MSFFKKCKASKRHVFLKKDENHIKKGIFSLKTWVKNVLFSVFDTFDKNGKVRFLIKNPKNGNIKPQNVPFCQK